MKQPIITCTSRSCKLLQVLFGRPSLAAFNKPNNPYFNSLSSRNSISTNEVVHLITFYTPLWGAILYNGFTYYQVNRMLSNATRMAVGISDSSYRLDSWAGRKAVNKWGYYPLILIGSWAFATMNRIFDFLHPDHKIFWLSLADVWFAGLMGLFNSIAYGLNSSVRQAIAERLDMYLPEKFKRLFPQALKSQEQQQELASLMVEGG